MILCCVNFPLRTFDNPTFSIITLLGGVIGINPLELAKEVLRFFLDWLLSFYLGITFTLCKYSSQVLYRVSS